MRITDYPEMVDELINVLPGVREDKKIHVTDLIFCLRKAWYRIKGYNSVVTSMDRMRTGIGHAIHEFIQSRLNLKYTEYPVEMDGIHGRIDGILSDDTILEIKTTRHISGIKEFWKKQILAYMKMYGTNKAILLIIDVITGLAVAYKIEAGDGDIEENWNKLIGRKRVLEEALKNGHPPDGPEYIWECERCPFRNVCMGPKSLLEVLHVGNEDYITED